MEVKILRNDVILEGQHRTDDACNTCRPLCVADDGLDRPDRKLLAIVTLSEQCF